MGLFTKLPEEPAEWAGLPSEPDHPESTAERLADATAAVDPGGLGVGDIALGGGGAVESIVFPVPPVVEIVEALETGEDE